jgi:hypothetical protein
MQPKRRWFRMTHKRNLPLLLLGLAIAANACAVMQPTDAGGPRAAGPPYPVVLPTQGDRTQASMLELSRVVGHTESARPRIELDPVTATIRGFALDPAAQLYLPKVGTGAEMNEEETRESLRRFIEDWKILIGAEPSQLSLIEQTAQPDGTQIASYEQRAFRYPLRGDYGKLQIQFSPSRRLLNLSSSCIPAAERVQSMLTSIAPRVKVEEVAARVDSKPVTYIDSSGRPQTYQLSSNNETQVSSLVTYALLSKATPNSLEFHVAWEVNMTNAPFKTLYLDAIKDEIIAAR